MERFVIGLAIVNVSVNKTYILAYNRSPNYLLLLTCVKENKKKMSIRVLRFMIVFIALVKFSDVYAVEYTLQDDDDLLKLEISDSLPTRINLKDEKINNIFMYPQNAAEVVVNDSGFLFVAPREEGNKVYLTVIGEHKTIQDLMLIFTSKTLSPVMLVSAASEEAKKDNSKQNNTNLFSNDVNTKELTVKLSKK